MATFNVKCDSYTNSIVPRIYNHLVRGTLSDVTLGVEGKFIRAHKLILAMSSEYFESLFKIGSTECKPIVIITGASFIDICLILDFVYLGQAQVPYDRLIGFLQAGERLQIRGIKTGRIHFMIHHVHTVQHAVSNHSFDATISSTHETVSEPAAKRPREDDNILIEEASEIMKVLMEENDLDNDIIQAETTATGPSPIQQSIIKVNCGQPSTRFSSASAVTGQPTKALVVSITPPKSIEKPRAACRFCSKSYSEPRVSRHEKECTENPNLKTSTCDVCHLVLKPSALTAHKSTKHGISRRMKIKKLTNVVSSGSQHIINYIGPQHTQTSNIDAHSPSPGSDPQTSNIEASSTSPGRSMMYFGSPGHFVPLLPLPEVKTEDKDQLEAPEAQ